MKKWNCWQYFGIDLKTTTAMTPCSNEKYKKLVGLIKDGMRRLKEKDTQDWDIALSWTITAKNSLLMKSDF